MKFSLRKLFAVSMLAVSLFTIPVLNTGCKTNLDAAGSYQGNVALYDADSTIATSKDVFDTFLKWERDNRATLTTKYPTLKTFADKIRTDAPGWFKSAVALRDTYKASPNTANGQALQSALDVLHQAVVEAQKYLVTAATP